MFVCLFVWSADIGLCFVEFLLLTFALLCFALALLCFVFGRERERQEIKTVWFGLGGLVLPRAEVPMAGSKNRGVSAFSTCVRLYIHSSLHVVCYVHTTTKAPDPIRTRKLNVVGLD